MMPKLSSIHGPKRAAAFLIAAVVAGLIAAACSPGGNPTAAPAAPAAAESGSPTATPAPAPAPTRTPSRSAGPKLELVDISGWLNSEPLTIKGLLAANKVVLVDFWTYTCVNCIRTFPFLREWYAKYKDRGLVILGVHSPEFEFEKVRENVEKATKEHQITWPVAQDNDMGTWRAFGNHYWPAKYLLGADGELRYTHFGEGGYVEIEKEIRDALTAAGYKVDDIPLGTVNEQPRDQKATTLTSELYGGYDHNYGFGGADAGQDDYYLGPDRVISYTDDGKHAHNKFYLNGVWRNEKEAVVHARETADPEDYIALKFAAASVNVVVGPTGPGPFDVIVEIDGKPLMKEQAGMDVRFDDRGRSLITMNGGRLYSVVRMPEFGIHDLKLSSTSQSFAVFAFTFGNYQSGI